jgi:putative intracellular protease/amidase
VNRGIRPGRIFMMGPLKETGAIILILIMGSVCPVFAESPIILMIVADSRTHPLEYGVPRKILEEGNCVVHVASKGMRATDMNGEDIPVDMTLDKVNPGDYRAVIIVGGYRVYKYEGDPKIKRILEGVLEGDGYATGICAGSYVLGKAGLLKGKKATGPRAHKLRRSGAIYTGKLVEADGRIITGKGPSSAKAFGEAVLEKVRKPLSNLYW